jgi:hypothetical protein
MSTNLVALSGDELSSVSSAISKLTKENAHGNQRVDVGIDSDIRFPAGRRTLWGLRLRIRL